MFVSIESSTLCTLAYPKNVFYDPLKEVIGISNVGVGESLGYHAIIMTIRYLLSGIITDRVRVHTPVWAGSTGTTTLTCLYTTLLSFVVLRPALTDMSVTAILIWWGIRFKLVRLISEEDTYPCNIRIFYGFYGAAGSAVGLPSMGIIKLIVSVSGGSNALGIQTLLFFLGIPILTLGVLSFLYIPKFEGEIDLTKKPSDVRLICETLRNPIVWMPAVYLLRVYFLYTGLGYTTPYLTALLAPRILADVASILHTYGITLASGPVSDLLAKAIGSPLKTIFDGPLVYVNGMLVFATFPAEPIMVTLVAMFVILLGFIASGVFGIVSSQLTEGRVPILIPGTTVGTFSVIGFPPDSFSSIQFERTIDDQDKGTYVEIFPILTGFAVVGAASAVVLLWCVKRGRKAEQVGPASSGPASIPSYKEAAEPAVVAESAFDPRKDSDKGSA